ncbi:MAG TPA: ABC transporter permease subunit [Cytophagaceae bacterium]
MNKKKCEEKFFKWLSAFFTFGIIGLLLFIIIEIFAQGLPALSWEMISETPKGGFYFGKEGGILNAIIGSIYLAAGASLIALFISLPVALFINIVLVKYKKLQDTFRFLLDLLWGVPPIVYGAFGFTLMMVIGLKTSLLAGILTVSLLISPIMIRAMDETIRNIPFGLLESAYSLGATRFEIAYKVYFRQALPGLVTAFLLGLGKGIGDTASVLFTAGFTDYIPEKLSEPAATLPLAIFFQLGSPVPEVKARAYAAAVVLIIIILIISITSRIIASKFSKNILK